MVVAVWWRPRMGGETGESWVIHRVRAAIHFASHDARRTYVLQDQHEEGELDAERLAGVRGAGDVREGHVLPCMCVWSRCACVS